MKKLVLVAAVAVVALSSCKKDYKCECTTGGITISGGTFKAKKADAEASCNVTTTGTTCKAVKA
ncbi:MAG: hypothetical protein ABL940_00655, partial [Bacteroidia bacterium]|jgi:hypothetical protein